MTSTINGHKPTITDSDGVRLRVRAHGSPLGTPETPRERGEPTYTRVIPEAPPADQVLDKAKAVVSLHVTEAADAWRDGWLLTESKPTLADVAKATFPTKGEAAGRGVWLAMAAAGAFRTATFTATYLIESATATRLRAGIALIVTVLTAAAVAVAHLLV